MYIYVYIKREEQEILNILHKNQLYKFDMFLKNILQGITWTSYIIYPVHNGIYI